MGALHLTAAQMFARPVSFIGLLAASLMFSACGGSPSEPSPPPNAAATITLTRSGVTPTEVRVPVGSQVFFVNNDTASHAISSDPVHVHSDCPPVTSVGTLAPGEGRPTAILTVARTCGFHDHMRDSDDRWKGRIVVQ